MKKFLALALVAFVALPAFADRDPGRRGPGHRPGHPGRPMPPPHRPTPRPHYWTCEASDRAGFRYRASDWNLSQARFEAVRACQFQSRRGGCFARGCY